MRTCSRECAGKIRGREQQGRRRRLTPAPHALQVSRPRGLADKDWSRAVIARDGSCVDCGSTVGLCAHHKEPWASNPAGRYDIDNGETLCKLCHSGRHPGLEHFILNSGGKRALVECSICGKRFIQKDEKNIFCSRGCSSASRLSSASVLTCRVCGIKYIERGKRAEESVVCSRSCAAKLGHQKRKDRKKMADSKKKWIKSAIKKPGSFKDAAKAHGMTTAQYAREVLKSGSRASEKTKRRARLAQTLSKMRKKK